MCWYFLLDGSTLVCFATCLLNHQDNSNDNHTFELYGFPGPCYFCGEIVCTREEQELLAKTSKRGQKLKEKLLESWNVKANEDVRPLFDIFPQQSQFYCIQCNVLNVLRVVRETLCSV